MKCAVVASLASIILMPARVSSNDQGGLPPVGARIRVLAPAVEPVRLVGTLSASDSKSLTIDVTGDGRRVEVPLDHVARLEVSRGRRGNGLKGAAIGVLAWLALVGAIATFDTLDESGVTEPLLITALVGTGAVLGAAKKTERWHPATLPQHGLGVGVSAAGVRITVRFSF